MHLETKVKYLYDIVLIDGDEPKLILNMNDLKNHYTNLYKLENEGLINLNEGQGRGFSVNLEATKKGSDFLAKNFSVIRHLVED